MLFLQAELLISDAILDDRYNGNVGDGWEGGDEHEGLLVVVVVVVIVVVAVSITSEINSDNNPKLDDVDPNNEDDNDDFIHVGTVDAADDDRDADADEEHDPLRKFSNSSTSIPDSSVDVIIVIFIVTEERREEEEDDDEDDDELSLRMEQDPSSSSLSLS
eukprot:CAMPEP_0170923354 /NCGR_PEP_ID=MMETSP0735-20130129/10987_1 /TAXON_ID=186038 /ORGANISM="Fragilariopsis kerguelensis, Strain L26-C5" /LENGTH=160 /DNA_ID=CAMNT_0011322925 /DNA_START=129 /DNA_END=607 /DNA_ORIENTATION=-